MRTIERHLIKATIGDRTWWEAQLGPRESKVAPDLVLTLPPGKTEIRFSKDTPASGDSRALAFVLVNFRLRSDSSPDKGD
jgi:hypothetical protein